MIGDDDDDVWLQSGQDESDKCKTIPHISIWALSSRTFVKLACVTSYQVTHPLYGKLQNIQPPAQVVRVRDKFSTLLRKNILLIRHSAWFMCISLHMPWVIKATIKGLSDTWGCPRGNNIMNNIVYNMIYDASNLSKVWATHWGAPGASEALLPAGVTRSIQFNSIQGEISLESSDNLSIIW